MKTLDRIFRGCVFHIKSTLRERSFLFWTLAYPILMAIFFNLAFGGFLDEKFEPIRVGISPGNFNRQIMEKIGVFELEEMEEKEASEALKEGQISGFIDSNSNLMIEYPGTHPTVIKVVLDFVKQVQTSHIPYENFHFDIEYVKRLQQKEASVTVIFYSLIGMVTLYGMYSGIQLVYTFQGNLSPLGARIQMTPIRKFNVVISGFLVGALLNLISNILLLLFMNYILRLSLFNDVGKSLVLILFANFLGVALGIFISASNKMSDEQKTMIATISSLFLSALAGMMGNSLKLVVQEKLPFVNEWNPVAIITDNMYRLNFLGDSSLFTKSLWILATETVFFLIISFLFLRREQYDSL